MKKGRLFLIPTVIANRNPGTIPDQVKGVVVNLDHFLVENIRTARRYLGSLQLGMDISSLRFDELTKHTSDQEIEMLMAPALEGKDLGVLSESGCPGVADPGSKAVNFAHRQGIKVVPLVGPSSILLALMASGFNGQKFRFHGYLPIDKDKLRTTLKELEKSSARSDQTEIFIEAPYRNNALLASILKFCDGQTQLCVARDITGEHESIQTLPIKQWRNKDIDLHKMPTVFLLSRRR